MITVHQRLQHYYSQPGAKRINPSKLKAIGIILAKIYDRGTYPPSQLVESVEENGTFTVRAYDDSFSKIIDEFLKRTHKGVNVRKKHPVEVKEKKQLPLCSMNWTPASTACADPNAKEPKKRKRIHIKK